MMDNWAEELHMFQAALEIEFPWYVRGYEFNHEEGRLDIWIGFMEPLR